MTQSLVQAPSSEENQAEDDTVERQREGDESNG